MDRHNKSINFNMILTIINIIMSIILVGSMLKINIFATKINIIVIVILVVLDLIIGLILKKNKKKANIIGYILSIILILIEFLGIIYINTTDIFFDDTLGDDFNNYSLDYYVVVNKNSKYKDLNKLGEIGYYDKLPNIKEVLGKLKDEYKNKTESYDKLSDSLDDLNKDKIGGLLIEKNLFEDICDKNKTCDKYREIKSISLNVKEKVDNSSSDKNSYNIYIGGTDFTNLFTDFNMVVTVNMKDNKILLTSTPRDYYVDMPDADYKELLGYVGVNGINNSMKAMSNLYDTNIDYYMKINTNSIVGLVDALGGIDFCSDKTYMTTHAQILDTYDDSKGKKLVVRKGCHTYNGVQILTIARERKAYVGGDRQRQKNCQAMMVSLFNKMNDASNITKYMSILDNLKGLYNTNIPKNLIQRMAKKITNGDKFTIERQSVDGKDTRNLVHSGSVMDYVMLPDENSVNIARDKIKEVYKD